MAIALVTSISAAAPNSGGGTTGNANTAGANLLITGSSWLSGSTAPTFADSKGNTYVPRSTATNGSVKSGMAEAVNPVVGASHSFSATGSSVYSPIGALAFSGADTSSPFDLEGTGSGSSATTEPGPITPGANGEVVVTNLGYDAAGEPVSIDAGFTKQEVQAYIPGQSFGLAMGYLIQTTTAAADPIWTRTNSNSITSEIGAWKAAAGGGGGLPFFMQDNLKNGYLDSKAGGMN